jgi:predicted transcriptional regulator
MSLRPVFAEMVVRGEKTVEFRRRFSRGHAGAKVLFYVSDPVRAVTLWARISQVDLIEKEELWRTHGDRGGISRETFAEYFAGVDEGYALSLENVRPLKTPVSLQSLRNAWPAFHPPQAFSVLEPGSGLAEVLGNSVLEGDEPDAYRDSVQARGAGA